MKKGEEPRSRVSKRDFERVKVIGKGGFSVVYEGRGWYKRVVRHRVTGKIYAMKVIEKDLLLKENKVEQVYNEKQIMKQLRHPFIVKLHASFKTKARLHFVLDFCAGGELFYHLRNVGRLTETQAKFYFAEILLGLEYLHKQAIVYRDLKPENVLLDIDGHIRLADFGLSKGNVTLQSLTKSFCGSPEYMSPEMLSQMGHTLTVDFYSLGAILYEMILGLPPHYSTNRDEMYESILSQPLHLPSSLSPHLRSLFERLLEKNPKLRLGSDRGIEEIKEHPWCQDINWTAYASKKVVPPFPPSLKQSHFDPEYTSMSIEQGDPEADSSEYSDDDWSRCTSMMQLTPTRSPDREEGLDKLQERNLAQDSNQPTAKSPNVPKELYCGPIPSARTAGARVTCAKELEERQHLFNPSAEMIHTESAETHCSKSRRNPKAAREAEAEIEAEGKTGTNQWHVEKIRQSSEKENCAPKVKAKGPIKSNLRGQMKPGFACSDSFSSKPIVNEHACPNQHPNFTPQEPLDIQSKFQSELDQEPDANLLRELEQKKKKAKETGKERPNAEPAHEHKKSRLALDIYLNQGCHNGNKREPNVGGHQGRRFMYNHNAKEPVKARPRPRQDPLIISDYEGSVDDESKVSVAQECDLDNGIKRARRSITPTKKNKPGSIAQDFDVLKQSKATADTVYKSVLNSPLECALSPGTNLGTVLQLQSHTPMQLHNIIFQRQSAMGPKESAFALSHDLVGVKTFDSKLQSLEVAHKDSHTSVQAMPSLAEVIEPEAVRDPSKKRSLKGSIEGERTHGRYSDTFLAPRSNRPSQDSLQDAKELDQTTGGWSRAGKDVKHCGGSAAGTIVGTTANNVAGTQKPRSTVKHGTDIIGNLRTGAIMGPSSSSVERTKREKLHQLIEASNSWLHCSQTPKAVFSPLAFKGNIDLATSGNRKDTHRSPYIKILDGTSNVTSEREKSKPVPAVPARLMTKLQHPGKIRLATRNMAAQAKDSNEGPKYLHPTTHFLDAAALHNSFEQSESNATLHKLCWHNSKNEPKRIHDFYNSLLKSTQPDGPLIAVESKVKVKAKAKAKTLPKGAGLCFGTLNIHERCEELQQDDVLEENPKALKGTTRRAKPKGEYRMDNERTGSSRPIRHSNASSIRPNDLTKAAYCDSSVEATTRPSHLNRSKEADLIELMTMHIDQPNYGDTRGNRRTKGSNPRKDRATARESSSKRSSSSKVTTDKDGKAGRSQISPHNTKENAQKPYMILGLLKEHKDKAYYALSSPQS